MSKSNKVFVAFLGGVILGGLLGVLLAPEKGSDTRSRLADAGRNLKNKIKTKFQDEGNEVTEDYADNYN